MLTGETGDQAWNKAPWNPGRCIPCWQMTGRARGVVLPESQLCCGEALGFGQEILLPIFHQLLWAVASDPSHVQDQSWNGHVILVTAFWGKQYTPYYTLSTYPDLLDHRILIQVFQAGPYCTTTSSLTGSKTAVPRSLPYWFLPFSHQEEAWPLWLA